MSNNINFPIDDLELSQLKSILSKDNGLLELFKNSDIKGIYDHIDKSYPYDYTFTITPIITKAFYNCGVDPLAYLTLLPSNFLFDVKSKFDIIIPNNITKILTGAFGHCGVTNITIPKSIIYIDYSAFNDCYNLTKIKYEGTKEEFNNIDKDPGWFEEGYAKIYCNDGYLWVSD